MPKVLVTPSLLFQVEGPHLEALRSAGLEVVFPTRSGMLSEGELIGHLPGISGTLASMEPYTNRVFAACPSLRVVARVGVGYDAVDVPAATAHGVAVTITPGANQDSVAEHTFALILGLAKNLVRQHNGTVAGGWERSINRPVRGATLGLAGLGRIGKAVAVRGRAFGMRLLAYDPQPDAAFAAANGVTLVPFDGLLAESDYLSLHLPMSAETGGIINRETLSKMKPTAFLVNTSRGGLVDEGALVEALRAKRLAGAGLDVFAEEPPGKSPLLALDNVLVTPHSAGTDRKALDDMALSAAQAVADVLRGVWPAEKVVNPAVKEKLRRS